MLAISHTSGCRNSERLGISTWVIWSAGKSITDAKSYNYSDSVSSILSCPSCAAVVVPQESGGRVSAVPHAASRAAPATAAASRRGLERRRRGSPPTSRSLPPSVTAELADRRPTSTGWLSSSGAIDHGRFAPGTLLGGRYRIVGRLGRGGMGEVYRADDLKLGQPVALKFLPADVDRDPARLTQLHTEVRMARQVSHPNVCRVYDIGEIEGQHVPVDGVRRRRRSRVAPPPHRPLPRRARARDRAADLRRPRRGARARRRPSRSQAGERDARRHRQGPAHRLRPGRAPPAKRCARARPPTWRRSSSPAARSRRAATSTRSAWCSTRSSPASARSTARTSRS